MNYIKVPISITPIAILSLFRFSGPMFGSMALICVLECGLSWVFLPNNNIVNSEKNVVWQKLGGKFN